MSSGVNYPNSKHISMVLSAFHQVPVRISHNPPFLHSLIILPKNDGFWCHLSRAVEKTRRWSIPLVINFILVIFAVILTLLDSFHSDRPGSDGYGITATWVFLLPLTLGWLRVGCEPEPNHLRCSLDAANLNAWVATEHGDQPVGNTLAIEFMETEDVDFAREDELKTEPLFNYSRAFTSPLAAELVLALVKNAAANVEQMIPVGNLRDGEVRAWVEGEGSAISDENRIGTETEVTEYCMGVLPQPTPNPPACGLLDIHASGMSSDPHPLLSLHSRGVPVRLEGDGSPISEGGRFGTGTGVTEGHTWAFPRFNSDATSAAQVDLQSFKMFSTSNLPLPLYNPRLVVHIPSRWAAGVCNRVALAAVLALGLQWGTSGAAVILNYSTPPTGLGCHAFSYLLYCVAATISFLLFLTSSILAL